MNFKKLTLAVGAALVANAANAVVPVQDYVTPDYPAGHQAVLALSSASAIRDTFSRLIAAYCHVPTAAENNAGQKQRNVYELGSASSGKNFRAYECTLKDAASDPGSPVLNDVGFAALAGQRVLVFHTVEVNSTLGGSIVGVMPIFKGIPMQFVKPSAVCTQLAAPNDIEPVTGFKRRICPTTPANSFYSVPQAGASDTEPASFQGVNLPVGLVPIGGTDESVTTNTIPKWQTALTAADQVGSIRKTLFAAGFGVAASTALKNAAAAAGIPNLSLSQDQVASILANQIDDWSEIFGPALSGPVGVCRRTPGSGTQASFNAYFNNNPCGNTTGTSLPVATDADSGKFGGLTVVQSATTSGVKTCLTTNAAGLLSIGILSLENNEVAAGWEFINLDGYDPFDNLGATDLADTRDGVPTDRINEDQISNGNYKFFMEPTMQWKTTTPLITLISENAGNPEITKQLPGILSLPSYWSVAPYSLARLTNTEHQQGINNYTRDGKSCKPALYQ